MAKFFDKAGHKNQAIKKEVNFDPIEGFDANGDRWVMSYNNKSNRYDLHCNGEFMFSSFINDCYYVADSRYNIDWSLVDES